MQNLAAWLLARSCSRHQPRSRGRRKAAPLRGHRVDCKNAALDAQASARPAAHVRCRWPQSWSRTSTTSVGRFSLYTAYTYPVCILPTVRYVLLALLAEGPAYGYELKLRLDEALGPTAPPYNIGQVYTTLSRLERDGEVTGSAPSSRNRNRRDYTLTAVGKEALDRWLALPTPPQPRVREDLFLKIVLLARRAPAEVPALILRERTECLRTLRALQGAAPAGAVTALLVEASIRHIEADLAWLASCEWVLANKGERIWNQSSQSVTSLETTSPAAAQSTPSATSALTFRRGSSSP